ncbi:MAG: ABC transporter ATP-binding protein [Planctomycetaceae bacterium]|nr:ABC transporter ATP-binding protein [Planctomycetaceae bacterium]
MVEESDNPAIQVSQLGVTFPGCVALRNVDLQVPKGTVFALLGENGAGKTTLIRVLTGFTQPTSGQCNVLGLNPVRDAVQVRQRIGYVSDAPAMYDWMRVDEIGWFAASFYPDGYLERYRELIAGYEVPSDRKIRHLSKGQRAKVALGLALAHDPELLILDEPTSGLDPLVRREFLESLLDRVADGRTVLLSSHQISEVERVADQVAILHQGQVRLLDSLQNLRDSFVELTIGLSDPLVSLPELEAPAEVFRSQINGRQQRMVVRDLSPQQLEEVKGWNGVEQVSTHATSLEDIFTACLRGKQTPKTSG